MVDARRCGSQRFHQSRRQLEEQVSRDRPQFGFLAALIRPRTDRHRRSFERDRRVVKFPVGLERDHPAPCRAADHDLRRGSLRSA